MTSREGEPDNLSLMIGTLCQRPIPQGRIVACAGLLVACAADRAVEVVKSINEAGYKSARVIGEVVPGAPKIEVVA